MLPYDHVTFGDTFHLFSAKERRRQRWKRRSKPAMMKGKKKKTNAWVAVNKGRRQGDVPRAICAWGLTDRSCAGSIPRAEIGLNWRRKISAT